MAQVSEFKEVYFATSRIICENGPEYSRLKDLLIGAEDFIDIDTYYEAAKEISDLLEELESQAEGGRTIFSGYVLEISPDAKGKAQTFRYFCRELLFRLKDFCVHRATHVRLRCVHGEGENSGRSSAKVKLIV
jgi:hypothetical protein